MIGKKNLGRRAGKYGMPSSHSQFVSFIGIYLTLYFFYKSKFNWIMKAMAYCLLGGIGIVMSYSRLYHGYHTPAQVLVGIALGLTSGVMYFFVVKKLRALMKEYKIFKNK
ncbi:Lipid phosphate phosphatase gamma, chloroplastic [Thelohanellus kitauei]|uniref:Lipid phosphate phosphatase gamma, chloroplastic n=1 Tax=Thelohanellus kitauei TaxID=669202 RepID=A0A0C2II90_THEKT|nr:Lipid phosphate phosphatase gamma, chloroplastic [Thelohanellus kitauei]